MKEGYEKCDYEHTLFIKISKEGNILIVSLYVDDLIFTRKILVRSMTYFLGLEVVQRSDDVFINKKNML